MNICSFVSQSMLKGVRKGSEAKDVNLNDGSGDGTSGAPPQAASQLQEKGDAGASSSDKGFRPKTSQSDTAHGSFFLRMGVLGKFFLIVECIEGIDIYW